MSKHKHPARHRTPVVGAPRRALRNSILFSSLAVGATGVTGLTVSGGVMATGKPTTTAVDPDADSAGTQSASLAAHLPSETEVLADRGEEVSRADNRERTDPVKAASLATGEGEAVTVTEDVTDDDPRAIARALLSEFGFGQDQFDCLDNIWTQESGWRVDADNPSSSAYGIPQALPGSKMASVADDWEWNPVTQIRWGLGYIADRYGTPCSAWGFKQGHGWY